MKVCMLTTGFPRFVGDLFGSFILELGRRLVGAGVDLTVIAPHATGLSRSESLYGIRCAASATPFQRCCRRWLTGAVYPPT